MRTTRITFVREQHATIEVDITASGCTDADDYVIRHVNVDELDWQADEDYRIMTEDGGGD